MKYRRYGKFRFENYTGALISLVGLLSVAIVCFFMKIEVVPSSMCGILCIVSLMWILSPYSEWFVIQAHSMCTYSLWLGSQIELPEGCTLIITEASISFPLSIQAFHLKERYAVSILRGVSLKETLKTMHRCNATGYTNITIERDFAYSFVYSFVYEREAFAELLGQGAAQVIIPESLAGRLDLGIVRCEIFVDQGY
mgnify:FL=1